MNFGVYDEMLARLKDIRPVAPKVHTVLLDWQRREHIGSENRLGPSLDQENHREHVWRVAPGYFDFGTRVPYSLAHQAHRMRTGRPSHMKMDKRTVEEVAAVIGRYVLRGDT